MPNCLCTGLCVLTCAVRYLFYTKEESTLTHSKLFKSSHTSQDTEVRKQVANTQTGTNRHTSIHTLKMNIACLNYRLKLLRLYCCDACLREKSAVITEHSKIHEQNDKCPLPSRKDQTNFWPELLSCRLIQFYPSSNTFRNYRDCVWADPFPSTAATPMQSCRPFSRTTFFRWQDSININFR